MSTVLRACFFVIRGRWLVAGGLWLADGVAGDCGSSPQRNDGWMVGSWFVVGGWLAMVSQGVTVIAGLTRNLMSRRDCG